MKSADSVFVIAEAGVNHNGSLKSAIELIDVAKAAGVDAVKFQAFKANKLVGKSAPMAKYQAENTGNRESQFEMLKKLELSPENQRACLDYCKKIGIRYLCSPFDEESLEMLVEDFDLSTIKFGSGEITNAPLLLKAAFSKREIILSTGMSTLGDVEAALGVLAFGYTRERDSKPGIQAFREAFSSKEGQMTLRKNVTLLHCTTEYPAPFDEVNLQCIDTLKETFGLKTGFSDHTPGIVIPIAAVARGATVIEKHFTLDKNLPGPDHKASLDPRELKAMVIAIRQVSAAIGNGVKVPSPSEIKNIEVARKSLVAAEPIRKQEKFTTSNLTTKRPGSGISPLYYWEYLGKASEKNYAPEEPIK